MEDLRKRSDSLTPPYPTFGEFIRGLMGLGKKARDIAAMFPVRGHDLHEATVNGWSAGNPPNKIFYGDIRKKFGYDFAERAFFEAAGQISFPFVDGPEALRGIRSNTALKIFLLDLVKQTRPEALCRVFGLAHVSSLFTFMHSDQGMTVESLVKILKGLPTVLAQLAGDPLGELTPVSRLAQVIYDCRLKSGMSRQEYAKHLGLDIIYLRYLEEFVTTKKGADRARAQKSGMTRDLERLRKLCQTLNRERVRLGMATASVTPPPTPPSPQPSPIQGEGDPSEVRPPALRPEVRPLPGSDLAQLVVELRREMHELRAEVAILKSGGVSPSPLLLPLIEREVEEPYRSPFATERWREHDLVVDAAFVKLVGLQIRTLCEHLGLLAGVRDESARARIRAELSEPLMIELLGSIRAFAEVHPGATLKLFESWRAWAERMK